MTFERDKTRPNTQPHTELLQRGFGVIAECHDGEASAVDDHELADDAAGPADPHSQAERSLASFVSSWR